MRNQGFMKKFLKNATKRICALALACSMLFGFTQVPSYEAFLQSKASNVATQENATSEQTSSEATTEATTAAAATTQAAVTTQAPTVIEKTVTIVKEVPVTYIECDENLTLEPGETSTFETAIVPLDASNKGLTYQSMNTAVATVDSVGHVTGKAPGTTYIVVTSHNGIQDKVKIKVNLGQVTKVKKKKVTSTGVTLTWKKRVKVSGYKVYMYNAKKAKYVSYKTVKKNKLVIKKLKSNTSYKFKIRAYKKKGSTVEYGLYSKVIKVKTKR